MAAAAHDALGKASAASLRGGGRGSGRAMKGDTGGGCVGVAAAEEGQHLEEPQAAVRQMRCPQSVGRAAGPDDGGQEVWSAWRHQLTQGHS